MLAGISDAVHDVSRVVFDLGALGVRTTHQPNLAISDRIFVMDGKDLRDRVKAIKAEIAAIQNSETFYRSTKAPTAIQKVAHQARRAALEAIKLELAALAKKERAVTDRRFR
jgi:hypothetical protein